jgi:hypothetical protein
LAYATRKGARFDDPGAELITSVTEFWNRRGQSLLITVGVAALVGGGAFFYYRSAAQTEERAASKLAEADVMFWQGYYPRAIDAALAVAKQYPSSPSGIDAHRIAGDALYWRGDPGDFGKAVAEYRTYLKSQGHGLMADAVRRSLAYALESDGEALRKAGRLKEADAETKEAAQLYEGMVGKFDRESSAEMLFAAARAWRALGQPDVAKRNLDRLTREFGETSLANRARIELAEISATPR